MLLLQYLFEEKQYPVVLEIIKENVIQLNGDFPIKTKGFILIEETKKYNWDYSKYTTVYRNIEDGVQFSNDGSIYIPPEPPIPPEPYIPTLDEIKEQKVSEMNTIQQTIIQQGTEVPLSDGTIEHFTLTEHDQTSVIGLQVTLLKKKMIQYMKELEEKLNIQSKDIESFMMLEELPWHVSDESIHCKFYSDEDMAKIGEVCTLFVTWHVTYFRDLRIYIRSLETKEEVESITYGIEIPEEFRSDPLKKMMEEQES